MRRVTVVALLTLGLLSLGAGLAAPAGAASIGPDIEKVLNRALPSDATGVATTPGGGAAYVCGTRIFINHGTDVTVDRVGSSPWAKYWNGPADKNDRANDVAVSAKGHVYVVGSSQKANGDYRALLLKYSATGTLLWARTWAGPTGSSPSGYRVAIDTKGRVVVVGQLKVKTATHVFVAQYSAAGKRLWARINSTGYMGHMRDIYLDGSNNIYVAGGCQATGTSSMNGLLLKYSDAGTLRWRKTYDSPYKKYDEYLAVCRRPGGGVYVAGGSGHTNSDSDGIVMRYSATGTRTVVARIGDGDGAYMGLYDAVVTSDGRLVVGGSTSVGSGDSDFVIYSLNAAGDTVWSHIYDSGYMLSRSERCEFLAAYGDGQVAASGFWARHASGDEYPQVARTHFFDAAGSIVDTSTWDGPVTGETEVHDMVAKGSYVWIAGQCFGDAPYMSDGFALRFDR